MNELKISSSSSTISLPQRSQTRTTRRTNSNSNHPLLVETIHIYSNNDDDDNTVSPPPPHPSLSPEIDHYGNIEYKLKLCPSSTTPITTLSSRRLDKLTTQLKWRLVQGGGFAIYELGVLDQGELIGLNKQEMESSLKILGEMLRNLLPLPLPSTGSTGGD